MTEITPHQRLLPWQYERMLQWVAAAVLHGETTLVPVMDALEKALDEARRGDPMERARKWAKSTSGA